MFFLATPAAPEGGEVAEWRRPVAAVVHLSHRARSAAFGQNLLVLDGRAPEGLPQVDLLQRHCETGARSQSQRT